MVPTACLQHEHEQQVLLSAMQMLENCACCLAGCPKLVANAANAANAASSPPHAQINFYDTAKTSTGVIRLYSLGIKLGS